MDGGRGTGDGGREGLHRTVSRSKQQRRSCLTGYNTGAFAEALPLDLVGQSPLCASPR